MKPQRKLAALFAELDALYAALPPITCQGRCAIACSSILLTDLEARRLQLATHVAPRTVAGPIVDPPGTPPRVVPRCIYLTAKDRCSVYAMRPLICRAYGLVRLMSCPHGCVPERWLQDEAFLRLAQAVERIGGGRILRTGPSGLEHQHGERFGAMGTPTRPADVVEATAERTRSLRALHGGRVIVAMEDRSDD